MAHKRQKLERDTDASWRDPRLRGYDAANSVWIRSRDPLPFSVELPDNKGAVLFFDSGNQTWARYHGQQPCTLYHGNFLFFVILLSGLVLVAMILTPSSTSLVLILLSPFALTSNPVLGTYGLVPCGLPAHLWLHCASFLSFPEVARLEAACKFLCDLVEDESAWRSLAIRRGQTAIFSESWKYTVLCAAEIEQESGQDTDTAAACAPGPGQQQLLEWAMDALHPQEAAVSDVQCCSDDRFSRDRPARLRQTDLSSYFQGWKDQRWTCDALAKEFPQRTWTVLVPSQHTNDDIQMTLPMFVRYMRQNVDQYPLYLFESNLDKKLLDRVHIPPSFALDLLQEVREGRFKERRWLLIGGPGSGSSFHLDPFACSAWNALLQGRKRWAFYPPGTVPPGIQISFWRSLPNSDSSSTQKEITYQSCPTKWWFTHLYPTLGPSQRPIEIIQEAGEIVFIPSGWWHSVLNLSDTVCYTQDFVDNHNARAVIAQLKHYDPSSSRQLMRSLGQLVCESDDSEENV
eukprot:g74186.t1